MLDRIITYSFYLLFFLIPLFWSSLNYELFEYNKMILTYGLTIIIVGCWLLKGVNDKRLTIKRTPLDIPLLLFLGANILSTIFSIDLHTSIWGYYSRSNGGLLSLISYLLLYWAFVSNMDKSKIKSLLKAALLSGLIVSIWGIFEHLGVSPSCVILRGEFNADCWIQKVQERVFATLGQPNWMAAYLSMLIFPGLYFFLTSANKREKINYFILTIIYYLAFTFTYSRGPTLGLIGGMVVFIFFWLIRNRSWNLNKPILFLFGSFLAINILFGSALTSFRLISKFAAPARPSISLPTSPTLGYSQLESGGTESGQIRFIVWQGALDIFKHYPIFGSGLETFAYSYYQFRPAAHNLTSEWDFLYNKAHNEYLNYLSTTGIVGFGTYLVLIGSFIWWSLKKKLSTNNNQLLAISLLASYISYLIYNFFLFSVVVIALFFYLFPAIAFVATESIKELQIVSKFQIFNIIYQRSLYTKITKGLVILATCYLLLATFRIWYADTLFSKGEKASDAGNPGRAYNFLTSASDINPGEPFFRSELAFSAASAATALKQDDATLSAQLKDQAVYETGKVLKDSPKNVSFLRTAIRTYFELSSTDNIYTQKTIDAINQTITLAPTDPKLYYNRALVLESVGKKEEAIIALKKALELKPNYIEALDQMKEATAPAKQ